MKLEKFDLEKAIHGAKVVTRNGRMVEQLTKFETSDIMCLYGVVDGEVYGWDKSGRYDGFDIINNDKDLFLSVEPQRIWVCVYKISGQIGLGAICYSKEEAESKKIHTAHYIKTIEITDEL